MIAPRDLIIFNRGDERIFPSNMEYSGHGISKCSFSNIRTLEAK